MLQDEAIELAGGLGMPGTSAEAGLAMLAAHCEVAVVTLGERGCIVQRAGEAGVLREPAASGVSVVDATGITLQLL